jgi:hypothetical protein
MPDGAPGSSPVRRWFNRQTPVPSAGVRYESRTVGRLLHAVLCASFAALSIAIGAASGVPAALYLLGAVFFLAQPLLAATRLQVTDDDVEVRHLWGDRTYRLGTEATMFIWGRWLIPLQIRTRHTRLRLPLSVPLIGPLDPPFGSTSDQ